MATQVLFEETNQELFAFWIKSDGISCGGKYCGNAGRTGIFAAFGR